MASAELRLCEEPGPAPAWALATSALAERETLVLTVLAVTSHRWRKGEDIFTPIARLASGIAVRAALMRVVRRQRPPRAWWRTGPVGSSFPSRHTAHAALAAAMLLDQTPRLARTPRIAATAYTLAVGASRVRLGVHWPSDVLGGVLVAVLWHDVTRNWGKPSAGTPLLVSQRLLPAG